MSNTNTQVTLTEALNDVGQAKQKRTRIKGLQKIDSFALRTLLQGNFSSAISFPFPAGPPPFDANEEASFPSEEQVSMLGECTSASKLNSLKKERKFIAFLESIHFSDAHLFCLMKDGEIEKEYPWLTREIVTEAFPGLL